MNFVKHGISLWCILKNKILFISFLAALFPVYLVGCSDHVHFPSADQLTEFESAGPSGPAVDMQRVVKAKIDAGPYRVMSGDVLELSMPIVLQTLVTEVPDFPDKIVSYLCRVNDNGFIVLPMVGQIRAAGKTPPEIESAIIDAYYPTYTKIQPSVIARVAEYKAHKVSITGAVKEPGIYELHNDQLSLVALLMQAGGIIEEGATRIRITSSGQMGTFSDKKAGYELYGNTAEYFAQSNEAERVRSASHYFGSSQADGIDAQMTFQQDSPSSTKGLLTIRHEQTILLSERLDITNEIQRWTILDKLGRAEPRVSTNEAGKIWVKLCELAELLNNPDIQQTADSRQKTEDRRQENYSEPRALASGKDDGRWTNDDGRTTRYDRDGDETIVLPIKGLNIPFVDVALNAGDAVEVEPLEVSLFTVIGLVNKQGNFPYPPNAQYNLMQAIAFAGGLDRIAEPRYVTVYRLKENGSIVMAPFRLIGVKKGSWLTESWNIPIKPGDIVAVEETPRTRSTEFLKSIFNIHFGAYLPLTEWFG